MKLFSHPYIASNYFQHGIQKEIMHTVHAALFHAMKVIGDRGFQAVIMTNENIIKAVVYIPCLLKPYDRFV